MTQTEILAQGRFLALEKKGQWEYVTRPGIRGAVAMVALTDEGELILVEQFRPPVDSRVIEIPAGLVGDLPGDEDEDFAVAAQRELLEETGYRAACLTRLMAGPPSPGMCAEIVIFYLATGLVREGEGGGDESEDIRVHRVPLGEVPTWLKRQEDGGALVDPKIYLALYFAQNTAT